MEIMDIIRNRRTIRSFTKEPIAYENLKLMIDMGRLAPSGNNLQPIKYIVINKEEHNDKMFPLVRWAGYTAPLGVPTKEEAPTAYIIVLIDETIRKDGDNDAAYSSENIVLTAQSMGIGSCIMAAIDRDSIRKVFEIEDHLKIHTVIALGYPNHKSEIFDMEDSVKYIVDENNNFRVPKRKTEDIVKFL